MVSGGRDVRRFAGVYPFNHFNADMLAVHVQQKSIPRMIILVVRANEGQQSEPHKRLPREALMRGVLIGGPICLAAGVPVARSV